MFSTWQLLCQQTVAILGFGGERAGQLGWSAHIAGTTYASTSIAAVRGSPQLGKLLPLYNSTHQHMCEYMDLFLSSSCTVTQFWFHVVRSS